MAWQDRERKTRQLAILLKPSLYDKLVKISDQEKCSINEAVNRLIEEKELKEVK